MLIFKTKIFCPCEEATDLVLVSLKKAVENLIKNKVHKRKEGNTIEILLRAIINLISPDKVFHLNTQTIV